jgi:predicted unusual protein kinase regulating ubiquinone biosynthesis (AarF/ABC1/UbiB family)
VQDEAFFCIIQPMAVSEQDDLITQKQERIFAAKNGHSTATHLPPEPPPTFPTNYTTFQENGRYQRILFFFGGVILHIIWWDLLMGRVPIINSIVRNRRPYRLRRSARQFRALALEMGGVMIKLGQFLSARVDVLPLEVTEELRGLQDEVPPEPPWRTLAVIAEELPHHATIFAKIEETPLAAASLGQTHRAWLHPRNQDNGNGEAVVIKVQRPNIEEIVRTDLDALRVVARWIMRYKPIRRRANVPALMEEFARTLWEELDYELEATYAERFADMYANDQHVYIPAVYRAYSTKRLIVLENVESIKITDTAAMKAAGIKPEQVAEVLLDTYFHQIFQEGFFHADPHPGNLFVQPRPDMPWPWINGDKPANAERPFWLIFVDFGMVGRVPQLMGNNLRKVLIGVVQKDARQLTDAYQELGFFLPDADLDRITEAQEIILERIWGRNLLELSRPDPAEVQELGEEFRDLLFEFPIQVPQDFIYLGRAIGMVSGLVSQLDEQINPWYFFEKYGEQLLRAQDSRNFTIETAWHLIRPYLSTPSRVQNLLQMAESGKLRVRSDKELLKRYDRLEKQLGRLIWSILGAASMLSATLLYLSRKNDRDKPAK